MNKKDIIIYGFSSKICNGKKDIIKKIKLSEIIKDLNFITYDDDNFPFTYYLNKKEIGKDQ
ncbi:hypothetical protein HTVC203P_gp06 [Pelagibacter phage HTVC203P]|jgi:hypothetical protein|nr:hypothetical protein HTVC203P_gp06 [Pelagibacter phage HTVC203P]|tara:strand:+ start:1223 stop:1405 length:183 start_codon:yes stop_codon:yes gene_type:complete